MKLRFAISALLQAISYYSLLISKPIKFLEVLIILLAGMRCIPTKQSSLYILLTSIVLENPNIILSKNHYIIISVQNYRIILENHYFREKYLLSQKQIRAVLLCKSLLHEYFFFSYLVVVVLAHRAYTYLTSDRSELERHLILTNEYRIFSAIRPSIKAVIIKTAILALAIAGSAFVGNITKYCRMG